MKPTGCRFLLGPVAVKVGDNKTGVGRVFTPVSNPSLCKACGECVSYCPCGAIILNNKRINILYDFCKGCLICHNLCQYEAIFTKKENTL